jgi:hypothetical protein
MSKRKRDTSEQGGEAHALVKIDSVIERILLQTKAWRDPCGCAYTPEHRVVREKESAMLQVGFFDSLTCRQICDVINLQLPGDYTIPDVVIDMRKRSISFRIQRVRREPINCGQAREEIVAQRPGDGSSMDMMKLRISFSIAQEDVDVVHVVINTLTKALPGATFKVATKPATYAVVFSCKDTITTAAIVFSAGFDGVIDFDHSQLVLCVQKSKPDILD